jgi:HEAT repeat protein
MLPMLPSPDFIALGAFGQVSDLFALIPHLPPRTSSHGPDAARAAAAILGRATADDLGWLERNRPAGYHYDSWGSLRPADLGTPPLLPQSSSAPVVALASMHSSGYLREAAVRLLATCEDGMELPYLLLRANDWVPAVRAVAESVVRARLVPAYAARFVASLPLVEGLRGAGRVAHGPLVADIERLLCCEAAWPALLEALRAPSAPMRQAAARIAVLGGNVGLVRSAATARDPVVARLGATAIAKTWSAEALRDVLPQLRRGSPGVRWIALAATCDKLPAEAGPALREALFDPATSVRELARYRWDKLGDKLGLAALDFAAFYREALSTARDVRPSLSSGPALAVVLRGLAETGTEADALTFQRFLGHRSALVRTAAVLGLGRGGRTADHDTLVEAMNDPSTRVAAEARRWVRLRLGRGAVRPRAPAKRREA